MRSGRPGLVLIDLPFDGQLAEIDFDPTIWFGRSSTNCSGLGYAFRVTQL